MKDKLFLYIFHLLLHCSYFVPREYSPTQVRDELALSFSSYSSGLAGALGKASDTDSLTGQSTKDRPSMGPVLKIVWYPSHSQLFDIDGPSAEIILCRKKRLITAFPGHYWEEIEPNLRNPGYNWDQKDPSPHLAAIQFPSFFRNN